MYIHLPTLLLGCKVSAGQITGKSTNIQVVIPWKTCFAVVVNFCTKSHFRNKINNTIGFTTEAGFLTKPKEAAVFLNYRKEVSLTTNLLRASGNTCQERSSQLSARQAPPLEKPQGTSSLFRSTSSNDSWSKTTSQSVLSLWHQAESGL